MGAQALVQATTRLYGIVGDPIGQVRSPQVFNPRFAAAGVNAILLPLHVRQEQFERAMRGLMALANLDGLIFTIPFKAQALSLLDCILPTAQQVGAVNAARREADGSWTGDMFDGRGLIRGLREEGFDVVGQRIMLLGAGGAGSAVAVALAQAGAASIALHDVSAAKAASLAERLAQSYPACPVRVRAPSVEDCDILINATPIGMAPGDGLPAALGRFPPDLVVVDVIMKPEVTPLLRHAQSSGCRTMGGRPMLDGQAEEVARFFGLGEVER